MLPLLLAEVKSLLHLALSSSSTLLEVTDKPYFFLNQLNKPQVPQNLDPRTVRQRAPEIKLPEIFL